MKKFLMATAASALVAGTAFAGGHGEVKIGVILGFTGPIEALTPAMADGAEFAMAEVSSSGAFLAAKLLHQFAQTAHVLMPQQQQRSGTFDHF